MSQQVVVLTATNVVLRWCYGVVDFDPGTETRLVSGTDYPAPFIFDPPISENVWTWNDVTDTFDLGAAHPKLAPPYVRVESPDGTVWQLGVDNAGVPTTTAE